MQVKMTLVAMVLFVCPATAQIQTNCTSQQKLQDRNSIDSILNVQVAGSNLDITGMKVTRTWKGGGTRTEIRHDFGESGCECNEPGLSGLLTQAFSVVNSLDTLSEAAQPLTRTAGDVGGFSFLPTEIPAVSGVQLTADWSGDTASLGYYSRVFNRSASWSYVDCVSPDEDWQGGRGVACQKAIETAELSVKKLQAGQPFSVNVQWTFDNAAYASYAFTPYAPGDFCSSLLFVGTPGSALLRHFVRLSIRGLDANGVELPNSKWSVSALAVASQGMISRYGFYLAPQEVFYSPVDPNGSCAIDKPYDEFETSLAVPDIHNGQGCQSVQPFCMTFTLPQNAQLRKVLVIREFDVLCLAADVTANGAIDLLDRNAIFGLIGVSIGPDGSGNYDPEYNPRADTNLDGLIDQDDLDQFDDENCTADTDASGTLNLFDSQLFVNWFNAHDPRADMDADGQFTIFDTQAYTNLYNAGCP